MRRIISLVVLFSLVVSMLSMSFAFTEENTRLYRELASKIEVNADYLYPEMEWVNEAYKAEFLNRLLEESLKKGFIENTESEAALNVLDDYVELFQESCAYVLENESEEDWSRQENWAKYLYRTKGEYYFKDERTFKDGQQVYTCYGINHIEALIKMIVYGLIKSDDSLMDLNAIPTRSEGVILAVRMAGGEKEALSGFYESSYVDVPDHARAYIAYAEHIGILLPVESGTRWDESELSLGEAYAFFDRVTGYDVSDDYLDRAASYSSLPSIYDRLGTAYDAYSSKNLLQSGEPLRNGDLVSLALGILYEKIINTNKRVIDQLLQENVITEEKKLFFDAVSYYKWYGSERNNVVNDFTKLLDYLDKDNVEVNFLDYHHNAASFDFRPHEDWLGKDSEWDRVIAVIYIKNGHNMSEVRGQELLEKIAYGLGASERQAQRYGSSVITQPKDKYEYDFKYGIDLNISKNDIRLRSSYVPEGDYLTRVITVKIFRQ